MVADVELKVRMLNINYGHNRELMEKCRVLKEYAQFVEVSRQYAANGKKMQEALDEAIDYCINHNILSDFMRKYRSEVLGMLLEEFDAEKYERTIRNEGREEGKEEGREEGIKEGMTKGIERMNSLTHILLKNNRIDDLKRAVEDPTYREQLFRELGL